MTVSSTIFAQVQFREYETGKVRNDGLALRSEPSLQSDIIQNLNNDTHLYIIGRTEYPEQIGDDIFYWFNVMTDLQKSSFWAYGKNVETHLNAKTPKNFIELKKINASLYHQNYQELERIAKLSDLNNWNFNNKVLLQAIKNKDNKAIVILLDNNANGGLMAVGNHLYEYSTTIYAIINNIDEEICLRMIKKSNNFYNKYHYPERNYNIVYGELFSVALIYNKSLISREMLNIDEDLLKQTFTIVNDETGQKWEYTCEDYIIENGIDL